MEFIPLSITLRKYLTGHQISMIVINSFYHSKKKKNLISLGSVPLNDLLIHYRNTRPKTVKKPHKVTTEGLYCMWFLLLFRKGSCKVSD